MTTETMSLLERKYAKRFEMLDADGSGVVDRTDFEMLAERLIDGLGVTPGSPKAERVRNGYLELCDQLMRIADGDGNGEIDRTEFITAMTRMAGDRAGFKRIIEPLARLNLSLCDADGDGNLNELEFGSLLRMFNATTMDEASRIFVRLDTSGDGYLSLEEILEALCEFYISTDPDAPGNQLFGRI
ncbi:EF-hand domain-containing protein [Actinocrispum sp. NPDC049592]|uniref:EF-hand domain-containing protein n=1 Tax=Actinocrispum sp. NPDC049592 TaxID=3154835 RepID=UPI003437812C